MIIDSKTKEATLRNKRLNHGNMLGNSNRSHGRKQVGMTGHYVVVDESNTSWFKNYNLGDIVRIMFRPRTHVVTPKGDGMDMVRIDAAKAKRERKNNLRARNAYRAQYGQGRVF